MTKDILKEVGFGLLLCITLFFGWQYWSNKQDAAKLPQVEAQLKQEQKITGVVEAVNTTRNTARANALIEKEREDAKVRQAVASEPTWADTPVPDSVIDALNGL